MGSIMEQKRAGASAGMRAGGGPVGLIALAVFFATVMAYGMHPGWIAVPHGLDVIMLSRRLQWLMVGLSLLCCVALIAVVVGALGGKRRAWWLLGLAPVLALFAHRFAIGEVNRYEVADEPAFVAPEQGQVKNLGDDEYVVGITLGDEAYAYPYAQLYWTPVVVQTDRDVRLLVMWSAFANSCVATTVSRDIKGRELDIVCEAGNALLIYNDRIGQFINGFTGKTPGGGKPQGFLGRLPVWKGTWKTWRESHPATRVMAKTTHGGPGAPVLPKGEFAEAGGARADTKVILFATTRPFAVLSSDIGTAPVNLKSGDETVIAFRDASGTVKAFDRHVEEDLVCRFATNRDPKKKAALIDVDTNTGWSATGIAVEGEKTMLGKKLRPVEAQEDVYLAVARYWWKDLPVVKGGGEVVTQPNATTETLRHGGKQKRSNRR
jgi:hypothetical protein